MKRRQLQIVITRQPPGDVSCYGTVFVGDLRLPPLDMSGAVLPDAPKTSFSDLDFSLVKVYYRHLANSNSNVRMAVRRYTRVHSSPVPRPAFHLHFFSEHFCQLLATVDDEKAGFISRNWYAYEGLTVPTQSEVQVRRRRDMLFALSQMAQIALDGQKSLFLKVEYRPRLTASGQG